MMPLSIKEAAWSLQREVINAAIE